VAGHVADGPVAAPSGGRQVVRTEVGDEAAEQLELDGNAGQHGVAVEGHVGNPVVQSTTWVGRSAAIQAWMPPSRWATLA
jgi:hypothetical protein